MRRFRRWGCAAAFLLAVGTLPVPAVRGAGPGAATAPTREAMRRFRVFCRSWMAKLRERERQNREHIRWRRTPVGVVGEYVGYDTESYRILPPADVDVTPVGRIVYMELRLRVEGGSEREALARKPQVIERTEVTELFRYDRGSWVY